MPEIDFKNNYDNNGIIGSGSTGKVIFINKNFKIFVKVCQV